jgi:multidrug efflux pump subunit AcrB
VALSQVATLEYGFEEGIIWHRNRLPTVTVRADIYDKEQPATLVKQILPTLETSAPSCRMATCWKSAARWRTPSVGRSR